MNPLPREAAVGIYEYFTGRSFYAGVPDYLIPPPKSAMWQACRRHIGLYAAIVSLASLLICNVDVHAQPVYLLLPGLFFMIASSIQLFNDYIDRKHDLAKGKTLATEKPLFFITGVFEFVVYGLLGSYIVSYEAYDWLLFAYLLIVWMLGFLYSFLRQRVVVQNLVVVLCGTAPVLCGMIITRSWSPMAAHLWLTLSLFIFGREVINDTVDLTVDANWKRTIPLRWGVPTAQVVICVCVTIGAVLVAFYPGPITIRATALLFVPCLIALTHPVTSWRRVKQLLDMPGYVLLASLLTAPIF